jgi:hypothetical protein
MERRNLIQPLLKAVVGERLDPKKIPHSPLVPRYL